MESEEEDIDDVTDLRQINETEPSFINPSELKNNRSVHQLNNLSLSQGLCDN